jgi:hypothetical protein
MIALGVSWASELFASEELREVGGAFLRPPSLPRARETPRPRPPSKLNAHYTPIFNTRRRIKILRTMPSRKKINLEKALASLDTLCPLIRDPKPHAMIWRIQ